MHSCVCNWVSKLLSEREKEKFAFFWPELTTAVDNHVTGCEPMGINLVTFALPDIYGDYSTEITSIKP